MKTEAGEQRVQRSGLFRAEAKVTHSEEKSMGMSE